ncbi:MAG TPA: hypothetical protein VIV60_31515 [Polyangiaceae bacterium]
MNISAQLAGVAAATAARVSANSVNDARSNATNPGRGAQGGSATNANVTATADAGPAARVTISNKARAQLRAAGVSPNEIAKVNLTDKNAVARAIQKARMARGKPSANTSSATSNAANTSKAQVAVAPANGIGKLGTGDNDAALEGDDTEEVSATGFEAVTAKRTG